MPKYTWKQNILGLEITSTTTSPLDITVMKTQQITLLQEKQRRSSSKSSTSSRPNLIPAFPQFSLLPTEIRLAIWDAALPAPTIIPITYCSSSASEPTTHHSSEKRYSIHHSKTLLPLLSTSRESRAVTLKRYHHSFGPPLTTTSIRADWRRDTLYLACSPIVSDAGMTTFIEALPPTLAPHIRWLAVDERVYNPVIDELPPFNRLPNLKGLTIVQHEDSCRRDWNDEMSTGRRWKGGRELELEFRHIVLPAVEEAMWEWVERCGKEGREWVFPRLRLVRLMVGGTRCCEIGGGDEEEWIEEEEEGGSEVLDEEEDVDGFGGGVEIVHS